MPLADPAAGLAAALAEVGERSFFGFVDLSDRERFAEPAAEAGDWLVAEVDFRGQSDGVVRLAVPAVLAADLVGAFIGEAPEGAQAASAVEDLLGEFANMVCGAWLTSARPDAIFSLGKPSVIRMPSGWTPLGQDGAASVLAMFNDQPVAAWTMAA